MTEPTHLLHQEAGKTKEFEGLLGEIETAETKGGALDAACEQLQQLVASVSPSETALKEAGQHGIAGLHLRCCGCKLNVCHVAFMLNKHK